MTHAASLLQPDSNPALYVSSVLTLYVDLPDTPLRASVSDPWFARRVHNEGVPMHGVRTAPLLGALLRLMRAAEAPSNCLRFARWPISDRSSTNSALIQRRKDTSTTSASCRQAVAASPANAQESTFSDDR